ncbi:helix-turn-helix domain-containing protein [Bacteroides propionicifaciens]|uniref:helix-turn-helix domain-containing protein n=1 Tax=Bacteroides propionicifaciens TaxID=392838 RepID=UPI0004690327|nr:AraC family transcriptional regulator [Bacteroides propionicifaciens]
MKIFIKNMVCPRCIMVVESTLVKLSIPFVTIDLGEVTLEQPLSSELRSQLETELQKIGFQLIDEKKDRLVEQVKVLLVKLIYDNVELKVNLSDYLSDKLSMDYTYISNQFSEMEKTTIEKYFIAQKIERVKELLRYDEMSLSEIAFQLNYSSVAHLSGQFKRVTGLTPSQFKQKGDLQRRPIDQV